MNKGMMTSLREKFTYRVFFSGNILMIGQIGNHLSQLVRLTLHLSGIQLLHVDTTSLATFLNSLRTAVRLTGIEGGQAAILLTGRNLKSEKVFLDAVNSLLNSGDYPHLFSNDEMEGFLQVSHHRYERSLQNFFQVLEPKIRKNSGGNLYEDLKRSFTRRVRTNLHIILTLPPSHHLIRDALCCFPAIATRCQVSDVITSRHQHVITSRHEYR